MMEEPPPIPESQTAPPSPIAPTSLPARLLNVFAVPGEVFNEVKASPPRAGNWLVPVLLSALVGIFSACVIFSQPNIQQQFIEQQRKVFAQRVKAGKMPQAQAEQLQATFEKAMTPPVIKVFASCAAAAVSFVHVFWWALVLWLLGRWALRSNFGYVKALEVTGLAMMISALGQVVTLLLMVNLGRLLATPSLGLVLGELDLNRKSHVALGAANVFSFWLIAVMSVGLARLAGAPFLRAAWFVFACWLLQESFFIASGMGQFAL